MKTTNQNTEITQARPRRDISGIRIMEVLPQDNGIPKPTSIEECERKTRNEWLQSLDIEQLHEVAVNLNKAFSRMLKRIDKKLANKIINQYGRMPYCFLCQNKSEQITGIRMFCSYLIYTCRQYDIYAPMSEMAEKRERENGYTQV